MIPQCPKCRGDCIAYLKDGNYYCLDCLYAWGNDNISGYATIDELITSGYVHSRRTAFSRITQHDIKTKKMENRTYIPINEAYKMERNYLSIYFDKSDGTVKVTSTLAAQLTGYTREGVNKAVREEKISGFFMSGRWWADWESFANHQAN